VTRLDRALEGPRLQVAVGLTLALVALLSWDPTPVGAWHDDGVYTLLGRALARGEGYHFVGIAHEPPAPRFPPLYPAILALFWLVSGDIDTISKLGAGLNLLLMTGAGVGFALYLRDRIGLGAGAAGVVTLLAWSNADLWWAAFVPLSEPLFMALMVVALVLLARLERPRAQPLADPSAARVGPEGASGVPPPLLAGAGVAGAGAAEPARAGTIAALAVALILLAYTRTAGVALVGGAVLGLLVRRRWAPAAVVAAGVGVALAPWAVWSARTTDALPDELRDFFASYSGWLGDRLSSDAAGFLASLPVAFTQVTALLARGLLPGAPGWVLASVGSALLLASVVGLGVLFRRSPGAALSVPLYLTMVVVWPFRSWRLVAPMFPLVFLGLALSYLALVPRLGRRGRTLARIVAGAYVVALVAGASVRLFGPGATNPQKIRTRQLAGALAAIEAFTEPGEVVGAPELWPAIPLYTDRVGAPSARFRPGGEGPVEGTASEQYRVWIAMGMDYVITEAGGRLHGRALDGIDAACPGALRTAARWEGQSLVRLGWDEACRARLLAPSVPSPAGVLLPVDVALLARVDLLGIAVPE
jgi:hypothetical protein